MTGANAKIKRILVRQNGQEKQVYPGPIYRYSYDFRNKSLSNLTSDGWTYTDINNIQGTANGLTASEFSKFFFTNSDLTTAISKASKIIIKSSGAVGYIGSWLANNTSRQNLTGLYSANNGFAVTYYGTSASTSYSVSTGTTFTQIGEFDFVNKTYKSSNGLGSDLNGSLTDAQISNIKAYNKYLHFSISYTGYISDISLEIY